MEPNPRMLVEMIFEEYPEHSEQSCAMLVNDFSSNMKTSARQEGKYAVLIVTEDSIFVCHTDSKQKSITKNVDVIERLLDTDNVNKYAEFRKDNGEIDVRHFERHQTKSLSGWLGITESQVSYEDAGEVQIFTKIDESTVSFQYSPNEFEAKFLVPEGEFELIEGILRTPNNEFPVTQVKFGRRFYDDSEEFLQDFQSLWYQVKSYREHFNQVASSMEPFQSMVFDEKDRVSEGKNGRTLVVKEHEDFNIVFASRKIEISESWIVDLVQRFTEGTETRLFHAGRPFSKDPIEIGSFKIFNETDRGDLTNLNLLYQRTQDARTNGQLSDILSYVIFSVGADWLESPLDHFLEQVANKYAKKLDAKGSILRAEDDVLEYKGRDWFTGIDDEILAENITKEIQSDVRLLIGGIDEEHQMIRPIDGGRFTSERIQRIQDQVEEESNSDEVQIQKINLNNGDSLLFVFSMKSNESGVFDTIP